MVFAADLEGARQGDWVPWINDIFTDVHGRVYAGALWRIYTRAAAPPGQFVVPTGGGGEAYREDKPLGRLWRIDADDAAVPLYGGVGIANGIGISPDGRLLYQVDSIDRRIIVNELTDDGVESRPSISTPRWPAFPTGWRLIRKDVSGPPCLAEDVRPALPLTGLWTTSSRCRPIA